jgi:cation:H+ antiporter
MTAASIVCAQFAACAAIVLWSGVRLSRYGDIIAHKTGVGGTWVGVILLATVTSLPELATGASAVLVFDVADIAVGDAIGSCMFNLMILAMLDVRHPVPLSSKVHQGHVLSAGFGLVQLGLVTLAMLAGERAPAIAWLGLHSAGFVVIYACAARTIFTFERRRITELAGQLAGEVRYADMTLRRALFSFAVVGVLLVGAASLLPGIAERLSAITGLQQTVVGSLLVAASTSLPEVVVSAAAMHLGALDMAVANLFGSNLFNVAVLGIDDLLYTDGVLLAEVSPAHVITATAAMTMTGTAIVGLTYRAARKRFRLSWDAFAIAAVYVLAMILLGLNG